MRWGDKFGALSTDPVFAHEQERDCTDLLDHDEEEDYLSKVDDDTRPDRRHFGRKIKKLLTEHNDLQGALRVLEVEMKQEERSPLSGHYRMLIHACGKAGYHKKAFILYKEYVGRQLRPNQGVYADLFNSCANSPYPEDALDEARYHQWISYPLMVDNY